MPPIFKALATINAWTLFVVGWIALIAGYARLIGAYAGIAEAPGLPPAQMPLIGGFAGLTLSVVVMKLRQMLE